MQKALIPASLELGHHQAVVWIDRVVLTAGMSRLIACLLEGELDLAPLLVVLGSARCQGGDRGFDAQGLKPFDDLGTDSAIDPHAAERDAWRAAMIEVAAATMIAPGAAVLAAVGDMKLAAAVATAKKAGETSMEFGHHHNHWWENSTGAEVVILSPDVVPVGIVNDPHM